MNDTSERVVLAVYDVLLPSLAMWSLELGRLQNELVQIFVSKMEELVSVSPIELVVFVILEMLKQTLCNVSAQYDIVHSDLDYI